MVGYLLGFKKAADFREQPLVQLRDGNRRERMETISSIKNYTPRHELFEALRLTYENDRDQFVRREAALALAAGYGYTPVENFLLDELARNGGDEERIVVALGKLGEAGTVQKMTEGLQHHKNNRIRTTIARVLGDWPAHDPLQLNVIRPALLAAWEGVTRATTDPLSQELAIGLGKLGQAEGLSGLLNLLNQADNELSCEAAKALHSLARQKAIETTDQPRVLEALLNTIKQPYNGYLGAVGEVAAALGYLGDQGAVEPLIDFVQANTWRVVEVTQALARLGDHRAIEPLAQLLDDHQYQDSHLAIAQALVDLDDGRGQEPLRLARLERQKRLKELTASSDQDWEAELGDLQKQLGEGNEAVRLSWLNQVASDSLRQEIVGLLQGFLSHRYAHLRANAVRSLVHFEGVETPNFLQQAVDDQTRLVRETARQTIERMAAFS